jgi:excinuclease UvrABC ATPase subunit
MGTVTDFDLSQLYDDSKSLKEGALTIPGYSVDGWYGRIFSGCGFLDPDKPIRKYTKAELHDLLYKEPTRIKVDNINLTYEGLIPRIQKSFLSKDKEALQPHIRAFVERAMTFTACPECDGTRLSAAARSSKIEGSISPTAVRCRSAIWPRGCAVWTSRRWRRCWGRCSRPSTRSSRSGWATSASTGRRARCRAARRSASR